MVSKTLEATLNLNILKTPELVVSISQGLTSELLYGGLIKTRIEMALETAGYSLYTEAHDFTHVYNTTAEEIEDFLNNNEF